MALRERGLDELVLDEVGHPCRGQRRRDGIRVLGNDQALPVGLEAILEPRNSLLSRNALSSSSTFFCETEFPLTEYAEMSVAPQPAAATANADEHDETQRATRQLSLHGAGEPTGAASSRGIKASSSSTSTEATSAGGTPQGHQHLLGARLGPRRQAVEPHLLRFAQVEAADARLPPPRRHGHAADPQPHALGPEPGRREQGGGGRRRRAVAVRPFDPYVLDVGGVGDGREPPVGLHPDVVAADVVAREVRVDGQVDRHLDRLGRDVAGQLADGLGDHLAVEVEPDGGDVTRLLAAEQVSGTPDLEVAHRDLEAGPEVGELADRLQALVRLLGEHAVGWVEEVRVRALAAPPDPSAQLVHLREAEQVGAVDDERVDRRHVETALDDRRADEHVVLVVGEVEDDTLEPALVHLTVRDRNARVGDELAHVLRYEVDVLHAVVHEEHLALTQELTADRLRDGALVVLPDVGEDRLAVLGRRVDQRQVADAGQRELERPRDRRRRERQDVDVGAQSLDPLLVLDAEALLLVDHEQAEVLERDVLGEQPVRADHDVDVAALHARHDLRLLLLAQEPRQHLDPHRIVRVALPEGLAVLVREQRRRREDRDLLAVLHRFERGTDRDFGLAEPDVAADQAVHRHVALHVRLDGVDRVELVGRLLVRERVLDLVLPRRVGREHVAGRRESPPVEHDELLGDLARRGSHPRLRLLEIRAAHPVQRGRLAPGVLAHGPDLVGRYVELVVALVFEQQVVAFRPADRAVDHPSVAGDAVVVVDDVVAGGEVLVEVDPSLRAGAGGGGPVGGR